MAENRYHPNPAKNDFGLESLLAVAKVLDEQAVPLEGRHYRSYGRASAEDLALFDRLVAEAKSDG